jgi:mono/diheme cytochrome c family protein
MKLRTFILGGIIAVSLSACISLAEDITPPPDTPAPRETQPPQAESSASGDVLFAENCARCHGADGSGNGDAANLRNGERMGKFPDAMLVAVIGKGNGNGMPAFEETLNQTEIASLVTYLRSIEEETPLVESADEETEQAESESDTEMQTSGIVRGHVSNGSSEGELPQGLIVQLEIYEHDLTTGGFNLVQTLETDLDTEGNYLFDHLEIQEGRAFLTLIEKDGVRYTSQPGFGTENNAALDMPITYYEISTDRTRINVDRLHIFFEPPSTEDDLIRAVEVFVVSNPTIYAVKAAEEGKAVLEFDLPEGASNIQFDDGSFGERYTRTENGFGDTEAILPGMGIREIVVFFELPYKRSLNFKQKISFPTDSVIVMTPQGLKVKSDYLQESGEREAQGLIYNTYSSQAMPIGATFEMKISGKATSENSGLNANSQQNLLYGILALGIVLVLVGVWFYLREQAQENETEAPLEYNDAETLMDAIIALDDAYRAGKIRKEIYRKRRNALKKQLKKII